MSENERLLEEVLQEEKWLWDIFRILPPLPQLQEESSTLPFDPPGFKELFPPYVSNKNGEFLLCLWDFLDSVSDFVGQPTLSLFELFQCLESDHNSPTNGQIILDELGCLFTNILFKELNVQSSMCDLKWHFLTVTNLKTIGLLNPFCCHHISYNT